ncbi:hypothetical protein [Nesterenkonia sp. F]|uniref:hypothetical protein n=1 Tax=Nesterenkonia sp. F TaxID=795955 RepID=UPI000255DB60|nr:hypothetical protein [Nesterenkonia sp. F]
MRILSSLLSLLLGLVALGAGIGQLTVWAPEDSVVAESASLEEAPLTVVTDGVVDPAAGREDLTVDAEGEYSLALAREGDVEAWIGDAAHNRITGLEEGGEDEAPQMVGEHVDGESTVPDPSGSDLWAAEEQAEGPLQYRWSVPDDSGDWALLIFRDGEQAAPTDVEVSVAQEHDQTIPVVLIVVGAVLILLALALFYRALARDRRRRGEDREARREDAAESAGAAGAAGRGEETAAGEGLHDEQQELETDPEAEPETHSETHHETEETAVPVAEEQTEDQTEDQAGDSPGEDSEEDADGHGRRTWWTRRPAVGTLAAVAVALAPAVPGADGVLAASSAEPSGSSSASAESAESGEEEPAASEGEYSVLLHSQLERILGEISEAAAAGDEAGDPEQLMTRFGGNAYDMRKLTYRNQEIDDSEPAPEPIGTEILAAAVTSSSEFPRQAVAITTSEDSETNQVLALEQHTARSNYKVRQAVTMMPGAEFPAIGVEEGGVSPIGPDEDAAAFSPEHSLIHTAVYLNNEEYYFGNYVADNAYIEDLHAYEEEVAENAEDVEVDYTRPLVSDLTALRLPDGSAIAVGSFDSTMQLRPEEGAEVNFDSPVAADIAGTSSTDADADVISREGMILHIPADEEQDMSVLGVDTIVSDVTIHD